jgi:hypothetical protein
MSFHLDYLLDLPGVKVESCTQIEGKNYFYLSALGSGIVCPQFYCANCQRYVTEKLEFLEKKRRHTQRYEQNIYTRVQQSSMEQIGREEGLSYDEIKGIFTQVNSCQKNFWESVKRLSIDEISMRKGKGSFAGGVTKKLKP